jgi:hypothetical protein
VHFATNPVELGTFAHVRLSAHAGHDRAAQAAVCRSASTFGRACGGLLQQEQQPEKSVTTQSASAKHDARAPLGVRAGGSEPHAQTTSTKSPKSMTVSRTRPSSRILEVSVRRDEP